MISNLTGGLFAMDLVDVYRLSDMIKLSTLFDMELTN